MDNQTNGQTGNWTCGQTGNWTNGQTGKGTWGQKDTWTNRQMRQPKVDRMTDRQSVKRTNGQTYR